MSNAAQRQHTSGPESTSAQEKEGAHIWAIPLDPARSRLGLLREARDRPEGQAARARVSAVPEVADVLAHQRDFRRTGRRGRGRS